MPCARARRRGGERGASGVAAVPRRKTCRRGRGGGPWPQRALLRRKPLDLESCSRHSDFVGQTRTGRLLGSASARRGAHRTGSGRSVSEAVRQSAGSSPTRPGVGAARRPLSAPCVGGAQRSSPRGARQATRPTRTAVRRAAPRGGGVCVGRWRYCAGWCCRCWWRRCTALAFRRPPWRARLRRRGSQLPLRQASATSDSGAARRAVSSSPDPLQGLPVNWVASVRSCLCIVVSG
jgi:hypothetical protein